MLSYIVAIVPQCLSIYSDMIIPKDTSMIIPIYKNGKASSTNLINYFILTRRLDLAKIVFLESNLPLSHISGSADDLVYLFDNIQCSTERAQSIIDYLVDTTSYSSKFNDTVRHLYSITQDPKIPGYCHITGYIPVTDEFEFFNIRRLLSNYDELNYILNTVDRNDRKELCTNIFEDVDIDMRTIAIDPMCAKLLLEYSEYLYYNEKYLYCHAIVHDSLPRNALLSHTFISNILGVLYDSIRTSYISNNKDLKYINMFEPLLTDDTKISRMEHILSYIYCKHIPQQLGPKLHKIIAKLVVTGRSTDINFEPDNCEWCQKLHRVV